MKMEAYANLLSQNNKPFSPTYNSTAFSLRLIASHSFGGGFAFIPCLPSSSSFCRCCLRFLDPLLNRIPTVLDGGAGGDGSLPSSLTPLPPAVLALIGASENDRKEVWYRCDLDGKLVSVGVNCLVMENMVLVAYSVEWWINLDELKLKDEARSSHDQNHSSLTRISEYLLYRTTQFAMADQQRTLKDDPFLLKFSPEELRIASEFLSNWLPFLCRDLCHSCTQTLSDRVRSIHPAIRDEEHLKEHDGGSTCLNGCSGDQANWDAHSVGSWKDGADLNDTADTNSLGSWKDGADGSPEPVAEVSMESGPNANLKDALPQTSVEASTSDTFSTPVSVDSRKVKMSWADMAQEDELEAEEETESTGSSRQLGNGDGLAGEGTAEKMSKPKTELSREQREHIRFSNVKRKKDFICLERVNGKIVNILDGLELHTGVFSAAEQIRIVNYVETLQEMGKKGQLKGRTYTAPQKWMRGKGRVTIQFGCCYNYATDKNGNPPGIIRDDSVDPIPQLFKVMIKRLVKWHVMPPNCVPDSCIVNIYDEGDCIPPHIDNHDFVRPFCTVSFISECNIVFGSNLSVVGPGEFAGAIAIPLPVGSVLVINGNSADVAKHCVPSVPTKRISITFRRMDESKRPVGFVPESDLQGLEPLSYEADRSRKSKDVYSRRSMRKQAVRREENMDKLKGSAERSSEPRYSGRNRQRPVNRGRTEG